MQEKKGRGARRSEAQTLNDMHEERKENIVKSKSEGENDDKKSFIHY